MNTKTIATVQINDRLGIKIILDLESGDFLVLGTVGDAEIWDGRSYLTEAKAREAANREYARLRTFEPVAA